MPKLLHARAPVDETEQRLVRKLATSRHAPVDWVWHAKMIVRSWEGARTSTIAAEVGSHPQTVRERIQAFNARGVDGLGIKPGGGRRPRLVEAQRSAMIALARTTPPANWFLSPTAANCRRTTRRGWRSGRSMRWRRRGEPPSPKASRWRAVRCGAFCWPKACAGDARGYGRQAKTQSLPQKDADRHPLHGSAGGSDDPLRRRVGAGNAADLPTSSWVVRRTATASKPRSSTVAATTKPGSTARCASVMDRSAPRPRLHATPQGISLCSAPSIATIPRATSISSPTTSRVTPVAPSASGSPPIHGSSRSLFLSGPRG